MKLQLRNSGSSDSTFDVPRNLGLALLAIGRGEIIEPAPPAYRPAKAIWSITASTVDGLPILHCQCQNEFCHSHLNASGSLHTASRQTFRHSGGCGAPPECPPKEIIDAYEHAFKRATTEERTAPKRKPGSVPLL